MHQPPPSVHQRGTRYAYAVGMSKKRFEVYINSERCLLGSDCLVDCVRMAQMAKHGFASSRRVEIRDSKRLLLSINIP